MHASLPRFSRRHLVISVSAAIVLIGMVASQTGRAAEDAKKPKDAPITLELAPSDIVSVVETSMIQPLALAGTLTPVRQTAINAEVEGVLADVMVRTGQPVKAGETLARFEKSDLANQFAARQANLERSRAEMQLAEKNRERSANLLKQGFISPNSFDATENSLAAATAQFKADEAQASVARKALGDSTVRAPFSGILSERKVEPGTRVGINQRLFSVVDLSEMELEAAVPVSSLAAVKTGQEVTLTAEGFGGHPMKGHVERIAPTADSASRMVSVYVRIKNPDGLLKGGMFGQGQLALAKVDHAPVLPFGAIRGMTTPEPFVLTVENGKAVKHAVKLGILNELAKQAVVERGVPAGATVVIAKIENIKPGQAIKLPASTNAKS